ncbi:MAG: hypothetical protein K2Q10_04655, partial [Rhodospirillales bacterium]|nr:hypothetical protein [Rhodospirillales bacterium]
MAVTEFSMRTFPSFGEARLEAGSLFDDRNEMEIAMSFATTAPSSFEPWSEEPSTRTDRRKI